MMGVNNHKTRKQKSGHLHRLLILFILFWDHFCVFYTQQQKDLKAQKKDNVLLYWTLSVPVFFIQSKIQMYDRTSQILCNLASGCFVDTILDTILFFPVFTQVKLCFWYSLNISAIVLPQPG